MLGHERGGLRATLEVELGEDRTDVVLDRLLGQEDLAGDLAVGLALGDEGQDAPLLLRQLGVLVRLPVGGDAADPVQDLGRDGRVQEGLAAGDRLQLNRGMNGFDFGG